MKKNLIFLSVLCYIVLVLTGCPSHYPTPLPLCDVCGKDPCECEDVCDICGKNPCECEDACEICGENPCVCDTPWSSDVQKNFLVDVGETLINTFNPNDQKEVVELADELYYKYKNYDWDAIGEEFEEEIDDIYSTEFESFFGMPRRMIDAINGKKKVSLEDIEILLTLSKFGRIIEFDDTNETVKITKTNNPSITAIFSDSEGTKCEFKVWGEGKEIEGSYTYEDGHWDYLYDEWVSDGERTIRVKVPTTIKMSLKHGSKSLVSFTFKWDSNINDYVNTSLNLQVINLVFSEETKVSTTEASAVFSISYSDKSLITAAVNLPKYELIDWEGGKDITEEAGENWIEEYDDKYETLLGKVGKGEVKLDILGKIQLKGGVTDGAALVDAYYNWNDEYYSDDLTRYQDLCDLLNKYAYLSVYYNNTTTEQAKLMMDVYEDSWGYNVEPVMYFPYDDTQIAVMTYFNSSKFLGIIDLVEELANSYIALDKHNLVFGEDFEVEIDY